MGGRRGLAAAVVAALVGTGLAVVTAPTPAGADTALVDYTCDLPPAGGAFGGEIPDTIVAEDLEVTIVDTPDPVVVGHPVHYDIDFPVLDLSEGFPPAPPEIGSYGIVRLKFIEVTATVPAGLGSVTAAFEQQPAPSWATVSLTGTTLKVRVQSPVAGSYIEVNPDVTPATVRIQTAPGVWSDLVSLPPIDVDGIATAAAGSSIQWLPPTLLTQVKYQKSVGFGLLLNVNWNDANVPCTPNDPSQVVVSTLVEAPNPQLSVTVSAPSAVEAGQPVPYEVTVANAGNVALSDVVLTAGPTGCTGAIGALPVQGQTVRTCQRATGLADVGGLSATATADAAETEPVTSAPVGTQVTALPAPVVALVPAQASVEAGATADYTLSVTNAAAVLALTGLATTSAQVGCAALPAALPAGQTTTVACSRVTGLGDVGGHQATVTVTSTEAPEATTAPAEVTVTPVASPSVTLTRDPADAVVSPGDTIDYALTITEQGVLALTGVTAAGAGADCDLAAMACTHEVRSWDVGTHEASVTVDAAEIEPVTVSADPATVTIPPHGYGDVPAGAHYVPGVDYARFFGIAPGYPGNRFRPTLGATRAQVAGMTWQFVGRPTAPRRVYADVPAASTHRRAIDWVSAAGLMRGASRNRFLPGDPVSRCQFVQLAWQVAGAPTGAPPPAYTDLGTRSCRAAVAWARAAGLLAGLADGSRFRPGAAIGRGEAVRVLHLLAGTEGAWSPTATWAPAAPLFDPTD